MFFYKLGKSSINWASMRKPSLKVSIQSPQKEKTYRRKKHSQMEATRAMKKESHLITHIYF